MSPSLALSLSLLPRRAPPPASSPRPEHPPLPAHQCHLLVRTPKRPLPAPRLLLAPRASASAAASPAEPVREGSASGRKGAWHGNRFLDLARLGAVAEGAAEAFFRSEIRRRLAVTAALIVLSRVGYFVPLPGFDRRLIPDSYLSFAPIPADDLGDFSSELKLSFFQLGISHQISASIVMQVLCHVLPSLEKLRKEGLDGHEKIKGYIWWLSLGFAIVAAFTVSCYSLQYSIHAASYRVKHVIITSFLLVLGAMSMTWICDTISESGFGHGSSLIICVGILTGYTDTLHKMLTQFSGNVCKCWPYILGIAGIFMMVTMGAVLVTEGCRKIKLQYYGFKLASGASAKVTLNIIHTSWKWLPVKDLFFLAAAYGLWLRLVVFGLFVREIIENESLPVTEVEPYIPFNINPTGMQPLLTTSYLLAFPSIMASIFGSPFWENLKEILNPRTSVGHSPWVYYLTYAFFVFVFNIFDIANLPKEISDYLNKMGARVPKIKPGRATVDYLTKIQTSTRFWGGLLLSLLATSSLLLDRYLRQINEGFYIGFTSVLIIVGSIIELRRSYQAYNVMPALSKVLRRYGA